MLVQLFMATSTLSYMPFFVVYSAAFFVVYSACWLLLLFVMRCFWLVVVGVVVCVCAFLRDLPSEFAFELPL